MSGFRKASRFQRGIVEGVSSRGRAAPLERPEFDIALLFASWDARCLTPITAQVRAKSIVLVTFEYGGTSGANDKHARMLEEYARSVSGDVVLVSGDSRDTDGLWLTLREVLLSRMGRVPVLAYLDLSAACRFYALAAVALWLDGLARSVLVTYAEAHYPAEISDIDKHEMFTHGRWESLPIPGLEGAWDPVVHGTWLVSLGFEGSKTFRAVSREDPDLVRVLLPDPGFESGYVERTLARNEQLLLDYAIPESGVFRAHAADAISAWRELSAIREGYFSNLSMVSAGTKPHSLAFALHAIASGGGAVVYLKPAQHKETETEPNGVLWTYEIRDRALIW